VNKKLFLILKKQKKNFDWKSKHKSNVFTDKKNNNNKNTQVYYMLDLQSYHIQKLDERRTSFKQVHLFDLQGFASSKKIQKSVCQDRGVGLRKTLLEHMKNKKKRYYN